MERNEKKICLTREMNFLTGSAAFMSLDDYYERHVQPSWQLDRPGFGRNPTSDELRRHFERTHFFGPAYREQQNAQAESLAKKKRMEDLHRQIDTLKRVLEQKTTGDEVKMREEPSGTSNAGASKSESSRICTSKYVTSKAGILKFGPSSSFVGRSYRQSPYRQSPYRHVPSRAPPSRHLPARAPPARHLPARAPPARHLPARGFSTARATEVPRNLMKLVKPKSEGPKPLVVKIGDEIIYDEGYKLDPIWMPSDNGGTYPA
ncbi:uncharacterized protein [Drosophila bipectinata]|uniref:uncharacterized protein isoform X2 n=1 Tax=Drosophila bipectinata TaxID=42026 RepID=UPI0038B260BE